MRQASARGLERVLLTRDPDNEASAWTIDANGGRLEDTRETSIGVERRCWITLAPPASPGPPRPIERWVTAGYGVRRTSSLG